MATQWKNQLASMLSKTIDENNNDISSIEINLMPSSKADNLKPYLVYVNPKAGAGKALKIYTEQISTLLDKANVVNTLVLTSK